MATSNFNVSTAQVTNADFRAWALALHNAIAAVLTYVAQTGEIDFTTVLTPSAINQKRGFRIYRFSDTLQATHPVFIRIDFGSGGLAITHPGLWVQIGQAVDGSGNLSVPITGTVRAADQVASSGAPTVVATDSYVSGSSSRLTLTLWPLAHAVNVNMPSITIERSKDATGADTVDAVLLMVVANVKTQVVFQLNGRSKANDTSPLKIPFDPAFTTGSWGRRISMFPTVWYGDFKSFNAPTGFLIYAVNDYQGLDDEVVNVYGVNRTYILTERGISLTDNSSGTARKLAVRND